MLVGKVIVGLVVGFVFGMVINYWVLAGLVVYDLLVDDWLFLNILMGLVVDRLEYVMVLNIVMNSSPVVFGI
jgi:hypothetical protein